MRALFVTGIGTGIGKTMVSAILAEALQADYWKPVQSGYADGTDSDWVRAHLSNPYSKIFPETYRLQMAASPHIAAREEGVRISLDRILDDFQLIMDNQINSASEYRQENAGQFQRSGESEWLIIEGAGGLLVPLNEKQFVSDLALNLGCQLILVSRNYLGSINHSLLTAAYCRLMGLPVLGWIFNDQYLNYESEITSWTGIRRIASIPFNQNAEKDFISQQAGLVRDSLRLTLSHNG